MDKPSSDLTGRTALVTGAGCRLGRAIALALGEAGVDVVVHYHHSETEAQEVADLLRERGRRAWPLQADLADPRQAPVLMAQAIEQAGTVDILVNSASIYPEHRLTDFSPHDLAENMQIHAMAPLQLARTMAERQVTGDIINMLDARMVDYDAKHAAYHLSKRALLSLTAMMALEFAPHIKVNGIAPGPILPPPGADEEYLQRSGRSTPLQRHGHPEDIVDAALFLFKNHYVTGQVIYVDGGRHLKGRVYE